MDDLEGYIEHGSEDALASLLERLKDGEFALLQLVEWLGASLTNENVLHRKQAVILLGTVLKELPSLTSLETSSLEDFMVAKLSDWQCLDAALDGLESLAIRYNGNREKIAMGLFTIISSNYSQPTRKTILLLLENLDLTRLRGLAHRLGDGVLALCDDERDPRNLIISFRLMQQVLALNECISELALEKYFDHLTTYFPVDFRPPKNDPHGITRKNLRAGLRATMAASQPLSQFMVPFLVLASKEALDRRDEKRLKDCLKTLATCVENYEPSYVRSILEDLYLLASTPFASAPAESQVTFWRRTLARAFADIPTGLYPDWISTITIDLNVPDLVACTAAAHPTLYHLVWSVLADEMVQHTTLAERIFNSPIHQCADVQLKKLPISDATCGLAVKLIGTFNRITPESGLDRLFADASPSRIIEALLYNNVLEKLYAPDILHWFRDLELPSRPAPALAVRVAAQFLPASEDILVDSIRTINRDVLLALADVMSESFANSLAKWFDLWKVSVDYLERNDDEEARCALTQFAVAYMKHCPASLLKDLGIRIASEATLREHPSVVLALLPAVAESASPLSETFLEMLVRIDSNAGKLEALRAAVSAMPKEAEAVLSKIECSTDVRALCTRILIETNHINWNDSLFLTAAVDDTQVLQSVLRHHILGDIPPLLAQRMLFQYFDRAPLASKIALLCSAPLETESFPVRETILLALDAELSEECYVNTMQLLLRLGTKAFGSDLDTVVPAVVRLTMLPHLPITRFGALQVLDIILNTVDVRYTAPLRKQIGASFGRCANDPRRTVRSFAATAFSRSLAMSDKQY